MDLLTRYAMFFGYTLALAAILTLDWNVSLKALAASALLLLFAHLRVLRALGDKVSELTYFVRLAYVSVEHLRLDPKVRIPAREILTEDLESEQGYRQAERDLIGPVSPALIEWSVAVGAGAIVTFLLFRFLSS